MRGLAGAGGAPNASSARPLSREHLGKIVIARFLELPVRTYAKYISRLERTPIFRELEPVVGIGSLSGLPALNTGGPSHSPAIVGQVLLQERGPMLRYSSAAFDREYLIDDTAAAALVGQGNRNAAQLIGRLRLINSRNRLTRALIHGLLDLQHDYVLTGDALRLKPLTQAALSSYVRARNLSSVDADPSRVSRLVRRLAIRLPGREVVGLSKLCPKPRDLHSLYLGRLIKEECARLIENEDARPMADRQLADALAQRFGARVLPRTVGYIRRRLDIPESHSRLYSSEYLNATLLFSPLRPLCGQMIRDIVPPEPGVYEIRDARALEGVCPVIYLGSGHNLRKRLTEHFRGWSNNTFLHARMRQGVRFRYQLAHTNWRALEREIYRAFCITFGAPPTCNRVSP